MVYPSISETRDLSLTENYLLAIQAFQEYLQHLKPDGMIAVISHNDVEGLRVLFSGLEAMRDITESATHALNTHFIVLVEAKSSKSDDPYHG